MRKNIRLTQKDFLDRAREIHGDKYNYSKSVFIRMDAYIKITCYTHGDFEQKAKCHIGKQQQGCRKCVKNFKWTQEEFLARAYAVHGNTYDYSESKYETKHKKITIICRQHGAFQQTPDGHIDQEQGCRKCVKQYTRTVEETIIESRKVHGDKYDYSRIKEIAVNGLIQRKNVKMLIICPKHGLFYQSAADHIVAKHGCKKCKRSKAQSIAAMEFKKLGIPIIEEYVDEKIRHKRPLPFDIFFEVGESRILIEFNGEQHYRPTSFNRKIPANDPSVLKRFVGIQNRDEIKRRLALKFGYKLYVIPHTGFHLIHDILVGIIKNHT